jgi:hypothetical protein
MKKQWQHWVMLALGLWLLASPYAMGYTLDHAALVDAGGIGAVLVVFNLLCLAQVLSPGVEMVNLLLGICLVMSPSSLGFTADRVPALNDYLLGAAVIALSVSQVVGLLRGRD